MDVASWHVCDMPTASSVVRIREQGGRNILALSLLTLTQCDIPMND